IKQFYATAINYYLKQDFIAYFFTSIWSTHRSSCVKHFSGRRSKPYVRVTNYYLKQDFIAYFFTSIWSTHRSSCVKHFSGRRPKPCARVTNYYLKQDFIAYFFTSICWTTHRSSCVKHFSGRRPKPCARVTNYYLKQDFIAYFFTSIFWCKHRSSCVKHFSDRRSFPRLKIKQSKLRLAAFYCYSKQDIGTFVTSSKDRILLGVSHAMTNDVSSSSSLVLPRGRQQTKSSPAFKSAEESTNSITFSEFTKFPLHLNTTLKSSEESTNSITFSEFTKLPFHLNTTLKSAGRSTNSITFSEFTKLPFHLKTTLKSAGRSTNSITFSEFTKLSFHLNTTLKSAGRSTHSITFSEFIKLSFHLNTTLKSAGRSTNSITFSEFTKLPFRLNTTLKSSEESTNSITFSEFTKLPFHLNTTLKSAGRSTNSITFSEFTKLPFHLKTTLKSAGRSTNSITFSEFTKLSFHLNTTLKSAGRSTNSITFSEFIKLPFHLNTTLKSAGRSTNSITFSEFTKLPFHLKTTLKSAGRSTNSITFSEFTKRPFHLNTTLKSAGRSTNSITFSEFTKLPFHLKTTLKSAGRSTNSITFSEFTKLPFHLNTTLKSAGRSTNSITFSEFTKLPFHLNTTLKSAGRSTNSITFSEFTKLPFHLNTTLKRNNEGRYSTTDRAMIDDNSIDDDTDNSLYDSTVDEDQDTPKPLDEDGNDVERKIYRPDEDSEERGEHEIYRPEETTHRHKKHHRYRHGPKLAEATDVDGNDAYMVVHFSFENTMNGRVFDSSGIHNNGKASSQTKITIDDTKCGSALAMNGGQIVFNSKAFHEIPHEAITIALWVKFPPIDNLYNLFTTEGTGAKYTFQVTNGKIHWSHLNDNGHVVFAQETEPVVNLGDWAHLAATYDSRTNLSKVIHNGDVVGEEQGYGLLSQNWDGKSGIGLSGGIQGTVDEFYMYNRALAASDIQDLSEECNLAPDVAIPMREGSFTGIIPEKEIEEALARMNGYKLTTAATSSTHPTTPTTTTTTTTTPTTTTTTTPTTTTTTKPTTVSSTTPKPTTPQSTTLRPPTTARLMNIEVGTPTNPIAPTPHPSVHEPTIPPLTVAVDEPRCQKSYFYYNSKLQGEMNAGLYIDLGHVHITTECLKRCCEIDACDLVYLSDDHCYAVDCFNAELCKPIEAFKTGKEIPSVYYVLRDGKTILDGSSVLPSASTTLYPPIPILTSPTTTASPYSIYEEVEDWDTIYEPQPTQSHIPDRNYCTQSMFFYNVKLRSGLKAGTVLVNTYATSMHECVRLCCEDRTCDIALLRKEECFTMHCETGHCTVEDGGDYQISFVSRQAGADFDDQKIFPTTSMPSPTLGDEEMLKDEQRLSLYLGFDHVVGSVVVDGSGHNNDAKLILGTSIATGRVGPGANMNGGHILLHGKHFRGKPHDAVTIATWLKLSIVEGLHTIFSTIGSKSVHRKGQYNFQIYNGRIRWFHRDQFSRIVFKIQTPRVLTEDRWYHVAGTYDSKEGMARIYLDGNLQGLANGQGRLSQDWGSFAAFGSQDGRRILFGFLDEIYMFSRALKDDEIQKYVNNIKCYSGSSGFGCDSPTGSTKGPFNSMKQPFLSITKNPTTPAALKQAMDAIGSSKNTPTTSNPTTKPSTTAHVTTTQSTTSSTTTPPTTTPSTTPTTTPSTTIPPTTIPSTTTPATTTPPTTIPSTTTPTPATTTSRPKTICKLGNVYRNRDLVGGLGAGNFTDKGKVSSIEDCMNMCCEMENCTVAYKVETSCFVVECRNERLCKTFTRTPLDVNLEIGFVNRFNNDGVSLSPLTSTEVPTSHPTTHSTTQPPTQPLIDIGSLTNTGTPKAPTTPTCSHSEVYHHVTLKGGLEAGNFSKLAVLSQTNRAVHYNNRAVVGGASRQS
ncbi:hypothetical protein QZH41_014303, partial [Actinostola sp. cb2023]